MPLPHCHQAVCLCLQVVQAAQATVLDLATLLGPAVHEHQLLPSLDRLLGLVEQETRAAVTQLLAHLGHAVSSQLTQDALLPRVLAQAGDLDFQVRRVCETNSILHCCCYTKWLLLLQLLLLLLVPLLLLLPWYRCHKFL